jgi:hypothetical protein
MAVRADDDDEVAEEVGRSVIVMTRLMIFVEMSVMMLR